MRGFMFERFLSDSMYDIVNNSPHMTYERVGEDLLVKVLVPGYGKEDIEMEAEVDSRRLRLLLKGPAKNDRALYVSVPESYDLSNVDAEAKDGILTVKVPKSKSNNLKIKIR